MIIRRTILFPWLLSLLLVAGGCADAFVMPGNHAAISAPGLGRRIICVNGKGVEVWTTRSPAARTRDPIGYVLFFVGNGDRAERWLQVVADGWGERPVVVWGMNYPGSGGSDGPQRLAELGPDALAVFDAARCEAGKRPIYIDASSLGTTAALCVAARRPVAGMVLRNPPPLQQLILGNYGWWNLWLLAIPVSMQIPADLDSVANASQCRAPVVFVCSGADTVVPPPFQRRVVDAYAGPERVVAVAARSTTRRSRARLLRCFSGGLTGSRHRRPQGRGSDVTGQKPAGYDGGMSQFNLPAWAQEQVAEIEAQVGRKITPEDLKCVDINEPLRKMTVARNPLLAEVRVAENDRNGRRESFPEYQ